MALHYRTHAMDELEAKPDENKNDNDDINPDDDDDDDDDDDEKAEQEENNEDGVLFYVNKEGLPMANETWHRMWNYASKLYPDAAKAISSLRNAAVEGEVFTFHTSQRVVLNLAA